MHRQALSAVRTEEVRRVGGGDDVVGKSREILGLGSGKSRILLWEDIWWS